MGDNADIGDGGHCQFFGSDCMKRICILGSTGSIGRQTLDVCAQHPEEFRVVSLAVNTSAAKAEAQAAAAGVAPERVVVATRDGEEAVLDLVRSDDVDVVVNALVGAAGLRASWETLRAGHVLALANKESLVVGGDLIMPAARALDADAGLADASGVTRFLMPIDSEHGAIYQCLLGEDAAEVSRLWVTASGGPFRGKTAGQLGNITPTQALAHPTWNMGAKISIDSSTLMNKGLEVIEAHHLFAMPYDRISVVVHPQSAIHSMVEFTDGSVKAHLGTTDMRIPIQFALSYPKRLSAPVRPLDFRTLKDLTFEAPDEATFRCLPLARHAGQVGGTLPCVMNAANEAAVAAFLAEGCAWADIARCVEAALEWHEAGGAGGVAPVEAIDQLLAVDGATRAFASQWLESGTTCYVPIVPPAEGARA